MRKENIEQSQVVIWDKSDSTYPLIGKHYLYSFFPIRNKHEWTFL